MAASELPPAEAELPTPPPPMRSFLTVDEAAELLRINRKTLYEHVATESPSWAVRFGRAIRISQDGLLRWARGDAGAALGSRK
jgi:excisionase family DNA binding protein